MHLDSSFGTVAKFSEKLTFVNPRYSHSVRISEMLVFRKILRAF